MKLFLSSIAISAEQLPAFLTLVGKQDSRDVKLALIENAADVYPEEKKGWVYESRAEIAANGFEVDVLDLKEYMSRPKDLAERLGKSDVIWLGGGNTYYLRWILRETEADKLIKRLVGAGTVYGGGSAGAVVAGPTLHYFERADRPDQAPEVIYDGLSLTDVVVVPHWADQKYSEIMKDAEANLQRDGFKTIHLDNSQALVCEENDMRIVPSRT